MSNLRIVRSRVTSNTSFRVQFTSPLNPRINSSNIIIESIIPSLPNPKVLKVKVNKYLLDITVQPFTPFAYYDVTFISTNSVPFNSLNGNDFILEDGSANKTLIQAPNEENSTVKEALLNYNDNNVYNFDGTNLVSHIVDAQDKVINKALQDIGQSANDNYLEILIEDERKIRGSGAFDRLNQEGAFEVIKVGLNKTGFNNQLTFNYEEMPASVITLLRSDTYNERLSPGNSDGTFDGLVLNTKNKPVTKLTSVLINYNDGYTFNYDITQWGYQLKNNIYDQEFGSSFLLLEENQFKLSELAFDDFGIPTATDNIVISYEYKSLGRNVDEESVNVYEIIKSTREVAPPIITEFSLKHSPVVTENGLISTINGVEFLNPRSCIPFSEPHPAFQKEIPYRLEALPSFPGEYSIDYTNGRVFVYGETKGSGTGLFPPAMNYYYKKTYNDEIDYAYNSETADLAASPLRDLRGKNLFINFEYQQNLIPNIDYKANVHVEVLGERVENRIANLTSLYTKNTPITNVFRLLNETTGEIYPVNRYSDTTIFFSSNQPPRIEQIIRERASFEEILNETIIVESSFLNSNNIRIFKIQLRNNSIINSSEDAIGSSFNTSVEFSRPDLFNKELYFDDQVLPESYGYERLSVGDFVINYKDGIIWLGVTDIQNFDLGSMNYKHGFIKTKNAHITSVSNIYNNINPTSSININYNYSDFTDNTVTPTTFQLSDERFLNGDTSLPYIYNNGIISVQNDIQYIRGIYDVYDLNNNLNPINFVGNSTFSSNIISVDQTGVNFQAQSTVGLGLIVTVPFVSPGVNIVSVKSVVRISDGAELWDPTAAFSGYNVILTGYNTPFPGDEVIVNYNLGLNGGSTPVVDYDRGGYYIDYQYLADELIAYYEYGDNVIDFRESTTVNEGQEYFVTYKVGSLRDSLYNNFGTLVDIPIITSFDTSYNRENYRDALQGALQSFLLGPTVPSIKNIVKSITKINPEIIETAFQVWSLGISSLYENKIKTEGELTLQPVKYDNGVLIEKNNESIIIPLSSNLRIEDGNLNFWFIPNWNGLDNDATLTFSNLTRDGYTVSNSSIFIGSSSYNPDFINNSFSVSKFDDISPEGLPSRIFTDNGIFIFIDPDENKWKILIKDDINEIHQYKGKIETSGSFYDVNFISGLGEINDKLRTITNKIEFTLNLDGYDSLSPDGYNLSDGYIPGYSFDGINFSSDNSHYLFDFGEQNKNRFSIYKDGSGYLNFEIFDSKSKNYKVSSNIQNWSSGEKHFISTSWKIGTYEQRDEMHLFIDGQEVPNILKYGGRPEVTLGDKWRSVKPEVVLGTLTKNIFQGSTLSTTFNSVFVTDPNFNFTANGIVPGDTINILEYNFGLFTIISVMGNTIELNSPAPATYTDARYSVNPYSAVVSDEVDLSSNVAVYLLRSGQEIEIPGKNADIPSYIVSRNYLLQTVLQLLGPAQIGDQILIKTLGLNHKRNRSNVYLWNDQSLLKTILPPPVYLDEVKVFPIILPLLPIGSNNATIVGPNFVATGIIPTNVSNTTEGRTLAIRVTGDNTNFTNPVSVVITGTSSGGPTETLTFNSAEQIYTSNKWRTISNIEVTVTPYSFTRNSTAIEIKEKYSATYSEGNSLYPIIRYSFQSSSGNNLESDGSNIVSGGYFLDTDINNKLIITNPLVVAGTYTITEFISNNSVRLSPTPPSSFSSGEYKIYNTTIGRSGFQNGFFTFETAGQVGVPYNLPAGQYLFDYKSYLTIDFDYLKNEQIHIGSDINNQKQAGGIIDDLTIFSRQLSDVRIGQSSSGKSVTSLFNRLKQFVPDKETLTYISFNEFPLKNDASFYKIANKNFLQSSSSVNENFSQSLVISDKPYIFENVGNLSTFSEGTIEFWVSPKFDTYNDPNIRYYIDATSTKEEEVTSLTSTLVKIKGYTKDILYVRLATDNLNTGVNYFDGGVLLGDGQTIKLGKPLPGQTTKLKISYIPVGFNGDRISIFKDRFGFLTFNVKASGIDYQVRQPIFWQKNSWHRIKALFKFNRVDNRDEIRLFVDGRESGTIRYGQGLLFGQGFVYGQGSVGQNLAKLITDINFKDVINKIAIGSTYNNINIADARFDNLKISNSYINPILCSGLYIDENYQSNIDNVLPVIEDLYTLTLLNFDTLVEKNTEFTIVRDKSYGIFNFILNVIDSFKIIESSEKNKQMLEDLIRALKPATSKVQINYYR